MSILNIDDRVLIDNSITYSEYHTHQPLSTRFENNDEIRIPIQEDMSTLPSESHIYIEGRLITKEGSPTKNAQFVNNGLLHLFSEIRYEMNGVVIDSITNPGITTTMKGFLSFTLNEGRKHQNAGWFYGLHSLDGVGLVGSSGLVISTSKIIDDAGNFNVCIPLKIILGFAEDYKKVILNMRQELVLIRSNSDKNAVVTWRDENVPGSKAPDVKVHLDKIYWKVPHITPGLNEELAMTRYINKNKDTQVAFRNWQMHVYPVVQETTKHTWAVTTMNRTSTPRYVILAFQTNREGDLEADTSRFDHCSFQNIRVYLNNERYPYDNLQIDFQNNRYATLYEMYSKFQNSYYEKNISEPMLDIRAFKNIAPLVVVDTSKQKEMLQPSSVILRVEFETAFNIPPKTTAFCLVLHDRVFSYNALTKAVKQL